MADHLALYGSLMASLGGLGKLGLGKLGLEGALSYVGPCQIGGRLVDLGAYPGLIVGAGSVEAELYEVEDAAVFRRLDEFEGFDPDDPEASLYLRRRVRLERPETLAWVYFYNRGVAERAAVPSGSWRNHVESKGGLRG